MSYAATTTCLTATSCLLQLQEGERLMSFTEVINGWATKAAFQDFYTETLLQYGGKGCFWEHPRLDRAMVNEPYEGVIIRTDAFTKLTADFSPFAGAVQPDQSVSVFPNLVGTARLIVPNQPESPEVNGRDLIAFLASAPGPLRHKFWRTVGMEVARAIAEGAAFRYLSTHGLGVRWLHVRLEQRPKYYHHRPYRK